MIDDTISLTRHYVMPTYGRFPIRLARGSGCRVWDEDGREYLDFGAGIAVCSVGHSHPRVTAALAQQAGILVHTSNLYYTHGQATLARRLVDAVGIPGRIFFCNSGAEANEGLFKLARRFGHARADGRHEVLTFEGSFHGRTLAGISATGQEKVKTGFAPLVPGFRHVPFRDLDAVRAAISPATAAILVEPVQGEGGIHAAGAEFLRGLRVLCDEPQLLLLFDEVQCGLGRTGDWCGWKSLGCPEVEPDGISWAKGIAGGFPLGAFFVRETPVPLPDGGGTPLPELLGPGSHGTTYGGNPLACAAAHAVLDIIEEEHLLENARRIGEETLAILRALDSPWITGVRGVGLMLGIELNPDIQNALPSEERRTTASLAMVERLNGLGLLSIPAGANVIRWLPPLNVTREDVRLAVSLLETALQV